MNPNQSSIPVGSNGEYHAKRQGEQGVAGKKRKLPEDNDWETRKEQEPISYKEDQEEDAWRWWEEEQLQSDIKWKTLEHNCPVLAPPYQRLPDNLKLLYDGKQLPLSERAEEVAGFYAKILDQKHLITNDVFNTNFFKDWRKVMTESEREIITDLKKCNFWAFHSYLKEREKKGSQLAKRQKKALMQKHGFCVIDGHRQKIDNFQIDLPGLFRGRGKNSKAGMVKRRLEAEDICINIGRESKVPEPPPGHQWKEILHDNTVTWLACWTDCISGCTKYVMLDQSSKLKGEKALLKYETARKVKAHIERIRATYERDLDSNELKVRQRAVALYLIDKLSLRVGNENNGDTVGCCSLCVKHLDIGEDSECIVGFDFLGKDSIRYFNTVSVDKRVYDNIKFFTLFKLSREKLLDRLDADSLNKYLNTLMDGLTAKVFRTYNASKTLQEQLNTLTTGDMSVLEKILAYKRANQAVALLCNHQRSDSKRYTKSMDSLKTMIGENNEEINEWNKYLNIRKVEEAGGQNDMMFASQAGIAIQEDQNQKLKERAAQKDESRRIFLQSSKLHYMDPRITVAWCMKWDIPIQEVFREELIRKFEWALETDPSYQF